MQKLLFTALVCGVILTACQKTLPPDGIEDPVFTVDFLLDSSSHSITAGQNGAYLFTRYTTDIELFHSINTFTDAQCPSGDCPGSLGFEFRDLSVNDTAFNGGFYAYAVPDTQSQQSTSYLTNFSWGQDLAHFPEQTLSYIGVDSATFHPPLTSASVVLPNIPHMVSLFSLGGNGLYSSIHRFILPENPKAFPSVVISVVQEAGGTFRFTAITSGSQAINFTWNNGAQSQSFLVDSVSLLDEYSVTVRDTFNQAASATIGGDFNNSAPLVTPDFSYEAFPLINPFQTGRVAVQWVDAQGDTWRSDRGPQNPNYAAFEVLDSEAYEPNERGDPTRRLDVRFSCFLFNTAGQIKTLSGQGRIAMARN